MSTIDYKKEHNTSISYSGKGDPTGPIILSTENVIQTTEPNYGKNTPNTPFYENEEYKSYPLPSTHLNKKTYDYNTAFPPNDPPSFIPTKNGTDVQTFDSKCKEVSTNKNMLNEITICMFSYLYLWLRDKKEFWAYIIRIDISTLSGYKWINNKWIYFDLPLYKIESLFCFKRNFNEPINNIDDISGVYLNSSSENIFREVFAIPLASFEILEYKDDIIPVTIGIVNDNLMRKKCHCKKKRPHDYTISLQISFPNNINTNSKDLLISYSNSAFNKSYNITINGNLKRNTEPLSAIEHYNNLVPKIPEILKSFVDEFTKEIKHLKNYDEINNFIEIKIIREKRIGKWEIVD